MLSLEKKAQEKLDKQRYDAAAAAAAEIAARTPDSEKWTIIDYVRVGNHLVTKILYPNCSKCSYEGHKVMVWLNVTEEQVVRWKIIDPHFRPAGRVIHPTEAPSPAARFPASPEGWKDALAFATYKK